MDSEWKVVLGIFLSITIVAVALISHAHYVSIKAIEVGMHKGVLPGQSGTYWVYPQYDNGVE